MSDRRRTVLTTRKAQLDELKEARFAEIARLVSEALEPRLEQLVEAKVAKAMADLAERQAHTGDRECATSGLPNLART